MKVLTVFAHPEPQSFGHALLERGTGTLRAAGHEVEVSDLYAMNFNPVATGADFTTRRFPSALQYDREQKQASQDRTFAPDIQTELDKLIWCDLLILQFPLWWFSVPAMMKGWIDRVFVNGTVYG
ncbi:MAG: NAD(P)H-dependent oxidoreductase, partial [Ferrovibrionaceae bacterium]